MNATLLCPGPSLARYRPQESSGMVIAVNRAAEGYACEVWAATDWPLIDRTKPLGTPTLYTIQATKESLERRGKAWPHGVVLHSDVAGGAVENGRHPWTRYTATAALMYAAWMGVKRINAWGVDWAGTSDWDGHRAGETRTTQRWRQEQQIWQRVIDEQCLEVTRFGLN